jgi:hypothetical protein
MLTTTTSSRTPHPQGYTNSSLSFTVVHTMVPALLQLPLTHATIAQALVVTPCFLLTEYMAFQNRRQSGHQQCSAATDEGSLLASTGECWSSSSPLIPLGITFTASVIAHFLSYALLNGLHVIDFGQMNSDAPDLSIQEPMAGSADGRPPWKWLDKVHRVQAWLAAYTARSRLLRFWMSPLSVAGSFAHLERRLCWVAACTFMPLRHALPCACGAIILHTLMKCVIAQQYIRIHAFI